MPAPELKRHDNGIWYIHWTEGRRSKRVSTGAKEMDGPNGAKAFFGTWLLMEQQAAAPDASGLTVGDIWTLYFERHVRPNAAAIDTAEWSWRNLKQFFADRMVAQVTPAAIDEYVAARRAGKIARASGSSTVRRELNALRACLNWAAHPKRKLLLPAELPAFDLPAESEPRDRWLRHDEIQRMLDAAAAMRQGSRLSRGERFLWLALETAARKGAILQLTWDRVDFETGVIRYDVPGRRKTKKRRSAPPISSALRPVLERAYAERQGDLVLDNGSEVWPIIKRIAKRAGVDDVSPHVLRHTAATHMARRGVPLWKVAGILACTMAMVERVYATHAPDGLRDAIEMISGGNLEAAE